jgi:2'-5' RNA ligase
VTLDKALQRAAAAVVAPSFEARFDRIASFHGRPGERPLVLRGDEGLVRLIVFQKTLGEALTKVGIGVDLKFTPHITLLYDDKNVVETPIDPINCAADEVVLVHSLLGQTRHIPLGRWKMKG